MSYDPNAPDAPHVMDKEEFWDVARKCDPSLTREQYDALWDDFQKRKAAGQFKAPPQ